MALREARITDAIEGRSSLSDMEATVGIRGRNFPEDVVADLAVDHLFGVAFDTDQNTEFRDSDSTHVGVELAITSQRAWKEVQLPRSPSMMTATARFDTALSTLTPVAAQAPSAEEAPQPHAEVVESSESEPSAPHHTVYELYSDMASPLPPPPVVYTQYRDEASPPPPDHDDAAGEVSSGLGNDLGLQQIAKVLASLGYNEMSSSTTLLDGSASVATWPREIIPPLYDVGRCVEPRFHDFIPPLFRASCVEDAQAHPHHQVPTDGLMTQHPMAPLLCYRAASSSTTTPSAASTSPPTPVCAPATSSIEEDVPVDTPAKCSMMVLNRGAYFVPNSPQALPVGFARSTPSALTPVPGVAATPPKGKEVEGKKSPLPQDKRPAEALPMAKVEFSELVMEAVEGSSDEKRCKCNHVISELYIQELIGSLTTKEAWICCACRLEDEKLIFNARPEKSDLLICVRCYRHLCYGVGSIAYPFGHSRAHSLKKTHWFVVLYSDPERRYCFKCNAEVPMLVKSGEDGNEDGLQMIRDIVRQLPLHPSSIVIDQTESEVINPGEQEIMSEVLPAESHPSGFGVAVDLGDRWPCYESKPYDAQGYAIKGIPNLRNICYLSAVLQCLFVLGKLRERMLTLDGPKSLITEVLEELFVEASVEGDAWPYNSTEFYQLQSNSSSFASSNGSCATISDGFESLLSSPGAMPDVGFTDFAVQSQQVMRFCRGFEEASKFLPNASKLVIDLDTVHHNDFHQLNFDGAAAFSFPETLEEAARAGLVSGIK